VSRLGELTSKIDLFFTRVEQRHPDDMKCRTGCSDCCHVRLSITRVEAEAIRTVVETFTDEQRANLARSLASAAPDRCAALDVSGRCTIYAARPVVCRSHGVPIRMGRGSLAVIQACHHNFTARGPAAADPDCILDQATTSTILLAIDRDAHADDPDGERVDLAELIRQLC